MGQAVNSRAPEGRHVDAVVVGAGFAGLYMVHRLRNAGFSVQGFDTAKDVGGTWYWNRYPGARCDIPSLLYSYSFSDELREEWRWSEKYATQPEILAYAEHVADKYDLRRSFQFETRVTAATFDEAAGHWLVETDRGESVTATWCIMGTGCLSVPRGADIKGSERFRGETYITGLWPHEGVDFTGKRVAMIGTGSSSIQSLPHIAAQAEHVTVFQRTPNFSLPALNRPLAEEEVAEWNANFPAFIEAVRKGEPGIPVPPADWVPNDEELEELVPLLWNGDGLLSTRMIPKLVEDERINHRAAEFVRARIRELVADPKVAEKLTPRDYPLATKRACVDTDYYATFNRDNVDLVCLRDDPIEEITEHGIRTASASHDVDVIIFALGFDAMTGALTRIDIKGRGGQFLRDAWAEGPKSYLGLSVSGFPNLFTVTGPGSPSVLTNMIMAIEQHVDWIADAIEHARDTGIAEIEARPDAQDEWVAHVANEADQTLFPRAASWYMGANVPGKPRVFMPYVREDYKQRIDAEAAQGYPGFHLSRSEAAAPRELVA